MTQIASQTAERDVEPTVRPKAQRVTKGTDEVLALVAKDLRLLPNIRATPLDKSELESLADSLRSEGQIEPATVRRGADGVFELVFGQRRHAAVLLNEQKHGGDGLIRCVVAAVADGDILTMQFAENFHRANMTDADTVRAIAAIRDQQKLTQKQLAEKVHLSERQARTYLTVADSHELIKGWLDAVTVTTKVRDENGDVVLDTNGLPKKQTRTFAGISLERAEMLARAYRELATIDQKYAAAPNYKPRAEAILTRFVQKAATQEMSRTAFVKQLKLLLNPTGKSAGEAVVVKVTDGGPLVIKEQVIRLDVKKLTNLPAEERQAVVAALNESLLSLGSGFRFVEANARSGSLPG